MALNWGNSLLCLDKDTNPVVKTINLTSSQNSVSETHTAQVNAVSLRFSQDEIADITLAVDKRRGQAVEKDRTYRLKKGLPETDLTAEQLVLFAIDKDMNQDETI